MEIRNIAIIAHVDHGKTSLTNSLMKQSGLAEDNFTMDTNELEKERGITIYSKNTSIFYKNTKINIVDTPGHADFSSEVERVLRSIDSVLLVVDAQEGPMPQTKFVLKKSLELGLKPIVVINKIDKPAARPDEVKEMVYELFLDLGANDEQLNFEVIYANGRDGIAKKNINDKSNNLEPLLDLILEKVVPASSDELTNKELRAQPFNLGYDNFLGRLAVCRIYEGKIRKNDDVFVKSIDGQLRKGKIVKMFTYHGLEKVELDEAIAGDIVIVAGIPDIYIGETFVLIQK
jgi:GTP-binding protein